MVDRGRDHHSKLNLAVPAGTTAGEYTLVASAAAATGMTDSVTTNNSFDIGAIAIG